MIYYLKLLPWIEIKKIDWYQLSNSSHSIYFLEENLDKLNWVQLSLNINAISILEKNLNKVHWRFLSYNKNNIIFKI